MTPRRHSDILSNFVHHQVLNKEEELTGGCPVPIPDRGIKNWEHVKHTGTRRYSQQLLKIVLSLADNTLQVHNQKQSSKGFHLEM